MFDLKKDPKGFVRLNIGGKIDEAEMRSGLDAFLAILPSSGKADFLYTIDDFEFPALAAIAAEFGYMPRLFAAIPRIGKIALVADAGWLRTAGEMEGALIPGLTIKAFEPKDADKAEAWLLGHTA
jgi:hypothetical protein